MRILKSPHDGSCSKKEMQLGKRKMSCPWVKYHTMIINFTSDEISFKHYTNDMINYNEKGNTLLTMDLRKVQKKPF